MSFPIAKHHLVFVPELSYIGLNYIGPRAALTPDEADFIVTTWNKPVLHEMIPF